MRAACSPTKIGFILFMIGFNLFMYVVSPSRRESKQLELNIQKLEEPKLFVSIDVYELVGFSSNKLILEIKFRKNQTIPKKVFIECAEENDRMRTLLTRTQLDVNQHLSSYNSFKLIKAIFHLRNEKINMVKMLANTASEKKKQCVVEMGESRFELKYGLNEDERVALRKSIDEKLNYTKNDRVLKVSLLGVNNTLKGIYSWNDDPLVELDPTSQALINKVKNISIKDCGGYSKINMTGGVIHRDYRKRVQDEIQKGQLKNTKIYVSLTTNPKRFKTIHYVLQNLDMELIECVFIILPQKYKQLETFNISRNLIKRYNKIKILSINHDIGPAAKILPTAQYLSSIRSNYNDIIISIDDDNIYASSMVSTLVYYSLQCGQNCAVATSSQLIYYWDIPSVGYPPQFDSNSESLNRSSLVFRPTEVIEGFAAIAYRTKDFDLPLFNSIIFSNKTKLYDVCYLSDDMFISYVLSFSKVSLMGIRWYSDADPEADLNFSQCGHYNVWLREELPFFNDTYAIHSMNIDGSRGPKRNMNRIKYKLCFQHLVTNFLNFDSPNLEFKSRDALIRHFRD
jgi:hypothetical protein